MSKSEDRLRQYETQFPYESAEGIRELIAHIPQLSEARFTKGDLIASDLLMDLRLAIYAADLSHREFTVLYAVLVTGYTQKEVAESFEVTPQNISKTIKNACKKIAAVYAEWEYEENKDRSDDKGEN